MDKSSICQIPLRDFKQSLFIIWPPDMQLKGQSFILERSRRIEHMPDSFDWLKSSDESKSQWMSGARRAFQWHSIQIYTERNVRNLAVNIWPVHLGNELGASNGPLQYLPRFDSSAVTPCRKSTKFQQAPGQLHHRMHYITVSVVTIHTASALPCVWALAQRLRR